MKHNFLRAAAIAAATLLGCAALLGARHASAADAPAPSKSLVNIDKDGVALQGYDPVAYFTLNKPVKGDPRFASRFEGAAYFFSSAQHKEMFEADPARYAPAFGGYCGYAASINKLSPIDPDFFQVIDGRLILQHNQRAWDAWNKDVPANVAKAQSNWPGLVERNGRAPSDKTLVNVDEHGVGLLGHDPVAYFTAGKPTQGDPSITAIYNGVQYRFASKENKDAFEAEPARYEPQFGGFCGYAASINKVSPVDPAIFQIINGRLVLQHTQEAYRLFNKNPQKNLARADKNWPGLVQKRGK